MPAQLASLIFAAAIAGLLYVDRQNRIRTSSALWIPALYLFVVASRPVSLWLNGGSLHAVEGSSDGSPVDAAFYGFLQLLAFVVLLRRRAKLGELLRQTWPVLLFLGYCLASLLWSDFPFIAFKRWVKMLGDVMMVLVVLTDPHPLAAVKRFIAWPTFFLVPLSILFIKYYPELGRGFDPWTGAGYFHGVSYNKNGLGVICLYCGIGYVWLFVNSLQETKRNPRTIAAAGCMLLAAVWLLAISSSATSLSCFLMGTILILSTRLQFVRSRPAFIHCMVLAMILMPAAVLFLGQMTVALDVLGKDSTLTDRTILWEAIFQIEVDPIFGAGYESYWLGWRSERLWSIFWWRPTQAHNGYIETYLNLGWIGIVLLAAVLFTGYRHAVAAIRRSQSWGGLFLACIVVSIPYNFTEATFRMQNLPWVFVLLAVIGASTVRQQPARRAAGVGGEGRTRQGARRPTPRAAGALGSRSTVSSTLRVSAQEPQCGASVSTQMPESQWGAHLTSGSSQTVMWGASRG